MESKSIVNVDTIKQDIEADKLDNNNDLEEEDEINPYHKRITNKIEKDNTIILQTEQWSILSNVVNYVTLPSSIIKCFYYCLLVIFY